MEAEEHFQQALIASLAGDQDTVAISEFRQAIAGGIPPEKELLARYTLGGMFSRLAARKAASNEAMVDSPEWLEAEQEFEKAIQIDRQGGLGYFSQPLGRAQLYKFDIFCKVGGTAKGKESPQAAIAYLESKVKLCDYLPTSPLLLCLLELGAYCYDMGENQRAIAWWQYLLSCAPVLLTSPDSEDEAKTREHAARNIQNAQGKMRQQSTPSGAGCLLPILGCVCLIIALAAMPGHPFRSLASGQVHAAVSAAHFAAPKR